MEKSQFLLLSLWNSSLRQHDIFFIQGYIGLLLGVAIFNIASIINMFLDKTIRGYRKRLEDAGELTML